MSSIPGGRSGPPWLVMADRSGRELPIQADLACLRVEVPPGHRVAVRLKEIDGVDGVAVEAC